MQPSKLTPSFEQVLEHERGPVVAVGFAGSYPPGSEGDHEADTMVAYLRYVLTATTPAAVVLDLRRLDYRWGDAIGGLALALRGSGALSAIVAAGATARALQPLLDRHFAFGIAGTKPFESMPEAVAHLERALAGAPSVGAAQLKLEAPAPHQGLKEYWAYAFACRSSMETILATWNAAGPWHWEFRDSHWYGDYLNARPLPGTRVRIHEPNPQPSGGAESPATGLFTRVRRAIEKALGEPERYTALLQIEADSPTTRADVDGVLQTLLERIGAKRIRRTEPYD